MNKAIVYKDGKNNEIIFEAPALISDLLNKFHFEHPCGGKGTCGKCKIRVLGVISSADVKKRNALSPETLLSCQTTALGDVTIYLPDSVIWTKAESCMNIPAINPIGYKYGFVIDIGTTTISVALYDQRSGKICTNRVARNTQAVFGADVLSRMQASIDGHSDDLKNSVWNTIHSVCTSILDELHISPNEVDAAVITGNTAMLYLLQGLNPTEISQAPFCCSESFGDFYDAPYLPVQNGTNAFIPSCISAFLGSDILTASLASQIRAPGINILADIGTNGEILFQKDGDVFGCSCAAGPAFEGVGLSCGMPAISGAIKSVQLMNGQMLCNVHEGQKAAGICGSGVVDLITCMRKVNIISPNGELSSGEKFIISGTDVCLTQSDVRQFQLSKSAIRTGIDLLMQTADVSCVDKIELAGSFGTHLSIRNAKEIGLLPKGVAKQYTAIGNAAATGAAMLMMNKDLIPESVQLSRRIHTISLSTIPEFNDTLIKNLQL